jgi:hypothetical protein
VSKREQTFYHQAIPASPLAALQLFYQWAIYFYLVIFFDLSTFYEDKSVADAA